MRNNLLVRQHTIYLLWIVLFPRFGKKHLSVSALPTLVDGYTLVEEFDSGELVKPHRIGIYKNNLGQKAVVKWWTGKNQTFASHSLIHEISMNVLLEKVHDRISKKISTDFLRISTPRIVTSKITNQSILIMSEFSEGKLLNEASAGKQLKEYNLSIRYLKTLTENLTNIEKQSLPKRKVSDYLFLYPALLSIAMLRQPRYIAAFLRGLPTVLFAFTRIWKQSLTLVHRDLHTKNILVSDSKTTIIDLQRVVLTYPLYELVTTLAVEWENIEFRRAILNSVLPKSLKVFQGLMIHFATHALTANNLPERYLTRYKAMLKFAVYDFLSYYLQKNI